MAQYHYPNNTTTGRSMAWNQGGWAGEINTGAPQGGGMQTPAATDGSAAAGTNMGATQQNGMAMPAGQTGGMPGRMDLRNHLPIEVIDSPVSLEEARLGSLKAMLAKYIGSYIVASFLVGTQNMVSWEGILYDVGNDYLTIYQENRDRYIVSDYYSLKFIEFYDTQRQKICDTIMWENNWMEPGM